MQLMQSRIHGRQVVGPRQQLGLAKLRKARCSLYSQSTRIVKLFSNNGQAPSPEPSNGSLVPSPEAGQDIRNLPVVQGAAPGKVNVQFVVPEYFTNWGQVLKVVGSLEELGNWKVEKAPQMTWHDGHTWTLDVQLPVGAINFKVVMQEPHGGVRWEQGTDRSVLIPQTTTATGAPVGQVGVTCNFNDVSNSRVEVRPDRDYLKQQLRAVEARVIAIQEKKRKLDQRMAVLTEGLKKYDQTVAMLENGVSGASETGQQGKPGDTRQQQLQELQELQQQQQQLSEEAVDVETLVADQQPVSLTDTAISSSSSSIDSASPLSSAEELTAADMAAAAADQQQQQQQPQPAPASWNTTGIGRSAGSIMVPILNPAELPSFDNLVFDAAAEATASLPAAAGAAVAAAVEDDATSQEEKTVAQEVQQRQLQKASVPPAVAAAGPDVSAIKASHVNETVLSATVDQLLAAAEDALARSSSGSDAMAVPLGSAGVDNSQLAEEYVEELLAAASALEQQADQRASLLLEAARQTGNSSIAQDIEGIAAAPVPPMPTPEELAEAAVLATAAALQQVSAAASMSSGDEWEQELAAAGGVAGWRATPLQVNRSSVTSAGLIGQDGTITFSAEDLQADVDANALLSAVMSRIGIALASVEEITISVTPAASATAAAGGGGNGSITSSMGEAAEAQQQDKQQHQKPEQDAVVVAQAAGQDVLSDVASRQEDGTGSDDDDGGGGSGGSNQVSAQQPDAQQNELQQPGQASPADAIAMVFSAQNSNGSSSGSSYSPSSSRLGFDSSSGSSNSNSGSSSNAASAAVGAAEVRAAANLPVLDSQEAEKILASKEAARRAAAEKVAAALAQVEEMRQSVMAANQQMASQFGSTNVSSVRGGNGSGYTKYRVSYKPMTSASDVDVYVSGGSSNSAGSSSSSSIPGTSRGGVRTVASAAVVDLQQQGQAHAVDSGSGQPATAPVGRAVREGLLALAALAATVQQAPNASASDSCQQQQQ